MKIKGILTLLSFALIRVSIGSEAWAQPVPQVGDIPAPIGGVSAAAGSVNAGNSANAAAIMMPSAAFLPASPLTSPSAVPILPARAIAAESSASAAPAANRAAAAPSDSSLTEMPAQTPAIGARTVSIAALSRTAAPAIEADRRIVKIGSRISRRFAELKNYFGVRRAQTLPSEEAVDLSAEELAKAMVQKLRREESGSYYSRAQTISEMAGFARSSASEAAQREIVGDLARRMGGPRTNREVLDLGNALVYALEGSAPDELRKESLRAIFDRIHPTANMRYAPLLMNVERIALRTGNQETRGFAVAMLRRDLALNTPAPFSPQMKTIADNIEAATPGMLLPARLPAAPARRSDEPPLSQMFHVGTDRHPKAFVGASIIASLGALIMTLGLSSISTSELPILLFYTAPMILANMVMAASGFWHRRPAIALMNILANAVASAVVGLAVDQKIISDPGYLWVLWLIFSAVAGSSMNEKWAKRGVLLNWGITALLSLPLILNMSGN
jgi:hypothetical protein